jgi:hypothetical protein
MPPILPIHHQNTKDTKDSRSHSFVFGKPDTACSGGRNNAGSGVAMSQKTPVKTLRVFLVILVSS